MGVGGEGGEKRWVGQKGEGHVRAWEWGRWG